MKAVETEVLIVGAGPAGATMAALLATYGEKNIVINKYGTTATTPRAHITNQRAMEVFRDLGIEDAVKAVATPRELMGEQVFCTTLAGEEIGRLKAWGNHPLSGAAHDLASPTRMCDFPQDRAEPILVRTAAARGADVRFNTEYQSFEQDSDGVTTNVVDRLNGVEYQIRSKYLIGADGGRSQVVDDLGLPLEGQMDLAGSANIVFRADLSRFTAHRPGVLYWILQPSGGVSNSVIRMVEPWNRWLATVGFEAGEEPNLSEDECVRIAGWLIGDEVPIELESVSYWTINDVHATDNMKGRVFCMGDAVHRHPPFNGLGSNTSIQDAFNLAWKLSLVLKGRAGDALLETYREERIPVGRQVVKRANQSAREMMLIYETLKLLGEEDPERLEEKFRARKAATPEAAAQRKQLREVIELTKYDFDCHGVEMNLRYESAAIVPDGTPDPGFTRDAELYHQPSSRPGANVPHVWLAKDQRLCSTLDLCGKGAFTLLTGIGGEGWQNAARAAAQEFGVGIRVHVIGPGQEYDDPYGDFARMSGVQDSGALLVRPDYFVCWRSREMTASADQDLHAAMQQILALH